MFEIILRYFWAVAILVTGINVAVFKLRSRPNVERDPELAKGYNTLARGCLLWGNVPWVVMGLGCTVGGVPTVSHYFRPREGNPYVLAWLASVLLLWILGTYWVLFKGGAEMLVRHPGLVRGNVSTPARMKLLWLLGLACGVFGMVLMWTQDSSLPMPH